MNFFLVASQLCISFIAISIAFIPYYDHYHGVRVRNQAHEDALYASTAPEPDYDDNDHHPRPPPPAYENSPGYEHLRDDNNIRGYFLFLQLITNFCPI